MVTNECFCCICKGNTTKCNHYYYFLQFYFILLAGVSSREVNSNNLFTAFFSLSLLSPYYYDDDGLMNMYRKYCNASEYCKLYSSSFLRQSEMMNNLRKKLSFFFFSSIKMMEMYTKCNKCIKFTLWTFSPPPFHFFPLKYKSQLNFRNILLPKGDCPVRLVKICVKCYCCFCLRYIFLHHFLLAFTLCKL